MVEIGHNSVPTAVAELSGFIQRLQALEDQKTEIAEDIRGVKLEAKKKGFDVKALNIALSLLKKDKGTLETLSVYADFLDIFN